MVNAIINVRYKSSRLPGKAILPLGGIPMINHVIKRANRIRGVDKVIVAVGERDADKIIEVMPKGTVYELCTEDEKLLEGFYKISEKYPSEWIIRITADNPLFSPRYAEQTLEKAMDYDLDHCKPWSMPDGSYVEVVKSEALRKAYEEATDPYDKTHILPYLYKNPDKFKCDTVRIKVFNPISDLRFTVDTQEGYEFVKMLVDNLGIDVSLDQIILFLLKNPHKVFEKEFRETVDWENENVHS